MSDMNLFVPITKIDAAQRLVYGVVTAETPDVAGEVCDYASTKPHYQKWSQDFAAASGGKSFGNLRAMHGAIAAGKLVDIAFNDDARRIEICGKVVDDDEWRKVEEGVYTGFSQGGRYLKRWPDPHAPNLTRYTAEPLEVSLVDHPCLPEATFAVIKADGSTELRKFKAAGAIVDSSLRAQRSNPENRGDQTGLLRRDAPRNDAVENFGKIGARHSKADKERIRHAHDTLVGLDPDCCPAASLAGANVHTRPKFSPQAGEGAGVREDADGGEADTAKFAKMLDRTLAKTLAGINQTLDGMSARIKKIEDQPLPLGTSSVRVAEKTDDAIFPQPEALLDRPGALEALAEAAIRKAQSQPLRAIPGFKPRQG